jgi:1-aminocyclopropane-1-carboxylate deaminase/D-cysteine desulfhydrase-like pyridoxal-dependent ACC family enzyme
MGTFDQLKAGLARCPQAPVGIMPTPLQAMRRLSQHFGRPVYFKRDDLAGLAMGGSKIRILRFTAGDAVARGADTFVAGGYAQSNHPAQVAAAGAALGIPTHVVLDVTKGYEPQGNVLLLDLTGARVRFTSVGSYDGVLAECRRLADRLGRAGRRPQIMTQTHESRVLSAVAYAEAFVELYGQLERAGVHGADVVVGSGGPTYAGLLLGAVAAGCRCRVCGVPPRGRGDGAAEQVKGFAAEAAAALGVDAVPRDSDISVLPDGPGVYGEVDRETVAAIRFVAAREGVHLDPVYGGHAMAVLLRYARPSSKRRPLVFVQTGGAPAIFAYERELATRGIVHHASIVPRIDRTARASRRSRHAESNSTRRPGRRRSLREVYR